MSKIIKGFEVEKILGSGLNAIAYLVSKKLSDTHKDFYVIKQFNLELLTPEDKELVYNEVNILSKIKSDFVVKLYEFFEENNQLNIVMEYCENGDLEKFLKETKDIPLNDNFIWKLFIQIVIGLCEIHNMNILHRDLKPSNIFLTKNNDIKIGDFGVSKQLYKKHFTQTVIGTPFYFPPEIVKGKSYNEKSDIWALGCILYELCTYKHPFESNNPSILIQNILNKNPSPIPNTFDSHFNEIFKELIKKEMIKRPSCKIILKDQYIMKKAKELGLYKKYQKMIEYNFSIPNNENIKNKKINNPIIRDSNSKSKNIKIRPKSSRKNNFLKPTKSSQSKTKKRILQNPFIQKNEDKNPKKINIKRLSGNILLNENKENKRNNIQKANAMKKNMKINNKDIELRDTLDKERNFKIISSKNDEQCKDINSIEQTIEDKTFFNKDKIRNQTYQNIFDNKNESTVKISLNQMIADFQEDNYIDNSPLLKNSDEKDKNERNSRIRSSSAFHIYSNDYKTRKKNNDLSESYEEIDNDKKEISDNNFEESDNDNDNEKETVVTIFNEEEYANYKKKEKDKENEMIYNLIDKTKKKLLKIIGVEDFQNILNILFNKDEQKEIEINNKIEKYLKKYESNKQKDIERNILELFRVIKEFNKNRPIK